jgi:hypothetical protein
MRYFAAAALAVLATADPCTPPPPPEVPETFFVSPSGSDQSPGSESAPFATLKYALTRLGPGDVLNVRDGTYYEQVRQVAVRDGTAAARIVVRAHPGEHPVLYGLFWLTAANYWTVQGLDIRWDTDEVSGPLDQSYELLKMVNGIGWEVLDNEISGALSFGGLSVAGTSDAPGEPSDWRVAGNCIHDIFQGPDPQYQAHGAYLNTGLYAGSGVFEDNLVYDTPAGSSVKIGWKDWEISGTVNVTLRHNTLVDGRNVVMIVGNTFPGAGSSNIQVESNVLVEALGDNYGVVRGVNVNNSTNVASDNAWHDAQETEMIIDYPDSILGGVVDGGGNTRIERGFDAEGVCSGYHPTDPRAAGLGRRW